MLRTLVVAFSLTLFAGLAQAEKRVALVIGISDYELISPLDNPKNDARLMASTLRDVGFEVVSAINVDYRDLRRAVRRFGKKLRASGKDAVGLLYFAGHGVQARGTNYLIPLGAEIESSADLDLEALSASNILTQMDEAGNRLNLVILDACRNNPFKGRIRSAGRGLARIQAASGSLIAFAAAPGQVAADGRGRNSPYTAALVEAIREPGLAVEQIFKRVRVEVESQTGGQQTPWEESSLRGDFYFTPRVEKKEPEPVIVQTPAPRSDKEALFWNSVKDSSNPAVLQAYVDRYPDGTFTGLAKVMIDALKRSAGAERRTAKEKRGELEERLKAEKLARQLLEKERRAREAELKRKLEEERLKTEKLKQERQKLAALTPQKPESGGPQPQTAEEMVALGRRLETGDGIVRNFTRAAHWYREAALKGHAGAKYRLGLLYYHGRGVSRSWTEAAIQILDAVKLNHGTATVALTEGTSLHDPQFLTAVQRRLKAIGFYRNRIDGRWGAGSKKAVLAYASGEDPPDLTKSETRQETPNKKRNNKAPSKKAKVGSGSKRNSPACKRAIQRCKLYPMWNTCVSGFQIKKNCT